MDVAVLLVSASFLTGAIGYTVEPTKNWVPDNPFVGPKVANELWFSQVKKPFPKCPQYKFPINTVVNCVETAEGGECEVTCIGGNHFYGEKKDVRRLILSCRNGAWGIKNGSPTAKTIQHCDGACSCRNGGICNGEKFCHCRKGFGGENCEKNQHFACPERPPQLPKNSRTECRGDTCEVQCLQGFAFSDGRSRLLLKCKGTQYVDMGADGRPMPQCEASCTPNCQNGGKCIAANVCECPPQFRGKQCELHVSNCKVKDFNGNFQCDHGPEKTDCRLQCPSVRGVTVQGTLDAVYSCDYASGKFQPAITAKCIYPPQHNITQDISTSDTQTNGTVTINRGKLPWPDNLIDLCDRYGKYNNSDNWQTEDPSVDDNDCGSRLRPKPNKDVIVAPTPSVCSSWNGRNIRTFDGLLYRLSLNCPHTLVNDRVYGAFHVSVRATSQQSPLTLQIQWQSVQYTLENHNGTVTLSTPEKKLSLPAQVLGMKVVPYNQHLEVQLESVGLRLVWDHHQLLSVHASEELWQKVGGLCGHLDGNSDNDLMTRSGDVSKSLRTFTDSWRSGDQACDPEPDDPLAKCYGKQHEVAVAKCRQLLNNARLQSCLEPLDQETLLRTCIKDHCSCGGDCSCTCTCSFLQSLVDECSFKSGKPPPKDWRNLQLCPISCPAGQVYQTCGPQTQATCDSDGVTTPGECFEGCFCPAGKLKYKGTCIDRGMCPCELRGREFQPGEETPKECNTCKCKAGKWDCTTKKCDKRCTAWGDPHYRTFDGKSYDFQGRCLYYLLKTTSLSVEGENIKCSGAIDEVVEPSPRGPACTRSVVIRLTLRDEGAVVIKLTQKQQTYVNGQLVTHLPLELGNEQVVIRKASGSFITVTLDDGLVVWWNGDSTVHIDAPYSYYDNTAGLCGTFNDNTKDDFLTPDGDIEPTAVGFANKWRTRETCGEPDTPDITQPCADKPANRKIVEEYCAALRSDVFKPCHWAVTPNDHYDDCITDLCAAKDKNPDNLNKAFCELLADYAAQCARTGLRTSWRQAIEQCAVKCPDGQEYDECGDNCALSCYDLERRDQCKRVCVEGCRCPKGHYLDKRQKCVPQKACNCYYDGLSFGSGYKVVRPGTRVPQLCTCTNALWQCQDATDDDISVYRPWRDRREKCKITPYAHFVTCAPKEQKTCKNMHNYQPDHSGCRPECVCDAGYVYDVIREECVAPEKCSCFHAGRSYDDGDTFREQCNQCVCQGGSWKCTRNECEATCSVWGDSHFTTFDGLDFDFLGECDYVLSKGVNEQGNGFSIIIQNVLCGTAGVTCSKTLEIVLSGKNGPQTLKLFAGGFYSSADNNTSVIGNLRKQINAQTDSSFHVYKAGVFVVVEVVSLRLQVKWDEGTRVYVKLGNEWHGRVAGLCGNNNGNSLDDFKSPSGGQEVEPTLFGHSWRTHHQCELPVQPFDSCQRNAQRRSWSEGKCGILKSPVFAACHAQVPVERYLKRCVFDTCACDQGGDCECLCTAVAAYADACAQKGIPIRWRSQHFCPMQCDTHCSDYSACTSPCPVETCENLLDQGDAGRLCYSENCVEGCQIKPCPINHIYRNDSYAECVPRTECKPVCLVRDNITYYEGDVTYTDECATCRCSKKKEVCSGQRCPPTSTTPKPEDPDRPPDRPPGDNCVTGWTRWLDRGSSLGGINLNDVEPLPHFDRFEDIYGTCDPEFQVDIECRVKDSKKSHELVDDNVVCNLQRGLVCVGKCHDYEIRVRCQCNDGGFTTPRPPPPPKANKTCDPALDLFKEYPGDCYKFLRCEHLPGNSNWHWVAGICGNNLMFNPVIRACDQIPIVIRQRPQCGKGRDRCRDDEEWNGCANQCEHTCHFYGQQLIRRELCQQGEHCRPGCVPKKRPDCRALGKFWRDENTCVDKDDCPCLDPRGDKYVQPHRITSTDDEDCQCVFNQFVCVPKKTTTPIPPNGRTTPEPPTIPTTLTPPILCPSSSLVRLFTSDRVIDDSAFSGSSILDNSYAAHLARLHRRPKKNTGAWTPRINDQTQYLQVIFDRPLALYGILLAGDPHSDHYVTLLKLVYSLDGESYHELIGDDGTPQALVGPQDSRAPVAHLFERPIEAKALRLYPLRWHNSIAIRFDLLLCNHVPTTTLPPLDRTTPLPPTKPPMPDLICKDPLGVDNGKLGAHQVAVSSIWLSSQLDGAEGPLDLLRFRSKLGWRPLANKQDEFVDFDFLEPRNVTGIQTKGGAYGWVTSYRVLFSSNKFVWNELPGLLGDKHVFQGNRDANGVQTNGFIRPLITRHLRLVPTAWDQNINWRVEPLGCFEPYPNDTKPPPPRECLVCEGVHLPADKSCPCQDDLFWTGSACAERNHCPCIDNFTPYPIGSKFENKECEECVCLLGGIISCKAKTCPRCPAHMRSVRNGCQCDCQLCPPTTRLCPTSGDCIPQEWWCNGVQNCADDEDETCDPGVTTVPPPTTTKKPPVCPKIECPPGYTVKIRGKLPVQYSEMLQYSTLDEPLHNWLLPQAQNSENPEFAFRAFAFLGKQVLKLNLGSKLMKGLSAVFRPIKKLAVEVVSAVKDALIAKLGDEVSNQIIDFFTNRNRKEQAVITLERLETNEKPVKPKLESSQDDDDDFNDFMDSLGLDTSDLDGFDGNWDDYLDVDDEVADESEEDEWDMLMAQLGVADTERLIFHGSEDSASGDPETQLVLNGAGGPDYTKSYGYNFHLPSELRDLHKGDSQSLDVVDYELCDAFCCVPLRNRTVEECKEPECPPGFVAVLDPTSVTPGKCPSYTCRSNRITDDNCDITGRIFRTFDGTIYKYDICSHTLARDALHNRWSISTQLQCPSDQPSCGAKSVIISDEASGATITILPNRRIIYNNFEFSAFDLARVSSLRRIFVIDQIGDTVVVVSRRHKFWVQYGASGNIRVGVSQALLGQVDGLCGFYNGKLDDDKRTRTGLLLIDTRDFGDSWYDRKLPLDKCHPQVCPVDLQQRALQMCQSVRHPSFGGCSLSVNLEDFLGKCVETTCECLKANGGAEGSCRCDLLQQFVGQCLAVNPNLLLTTWRSVHRCEPVCRPPLVHHDCHRQRCELQCGLPSHSNGEMSTVCPRIPNTCFSGCFCPEGTVRRGDDCVTLDDCEDCKCSLFGSSKFVSYDGSSFSFKGNCTYLVTRDLVVPGSYNFQVYATIKPCGLTEDESCVSALHVTAGEHTLHIERHGDEVKLLADGFPVSTWPYQSTWLRVIHPSELKLIVQLPLVKLNLVVNLDTLQFQITVPSVRYGSRMEGLCGNCNGLTIDDLLVNPFNKPQHDGRYDLIDFITSWRVDEPRLGINTRTCGNQTVCKPLTIDNNVCYKLIVQLGIFGQCPLLVDPLPFIVACQKDTCTDDGDDKELACDALTAYAEACNQVGICADWRPFAPCPAQCLPGMTYKPCDCDVTCDTGVDRVDETNLALIYKGRCLHTARHEGCFCPPDQVLHHGRCVAPKECVTCGGGRHVGDKWYPDKCSSCECQASGQVSCVQQKCGDDTDHVCLKGYKLLVRHSDFDCCPIRICVPDIEKPGKICEKPQLPDCGPDQHRVADKDVNDCPIYRCECKPRDQCEPPPVLTLQPGEGLEQIKDGCCPRYRIVCVPDNCPKLPLTCTEPHYELIVEKPPGACCAVHKCVPPKDKCIQVTNDRVQVHRPGDQWQLPGEPCIAYECVLANGRLGIVTTVLTCEKKCPLGFEYEHTNSAKCCGSCVPTGCVHNGKVYKPNDKWISPDKCTAYECIPGEGQLFIHELHETCPDVRLCPKDQLVDDGGCCKRCKVIPPPLDQKQCVAVSLARIRTIGLVTFTDPVHGKCQNNEELEGVTECDGSCPSAYRFSSQAGKYTDDCQCCGATGFRPLQVKVSCADGAKLDHVLQVPTSCKCDACSKHHPGRIAADADDHIETQAKTPKVEEAEDDDDEDFDLQDLLSKNGGVIAR